jgi:hypothetical protein
MKVVCRIEVEEYLCVVKQYKQISFRGEDEHGATAGLDAHVEVVKAGGSAAIIQSSSRGAPACSNEKK